MAITDQQILPNGQANTPTDPGGAAPAPGSESPGTAGSQQGTPSETPTDPGGVEPAAGAASPGTAGPAVAPASAGSAADPGSAVPASAGSASAAGSAVPASAGNASDPGAVTPINPAPVNKEGAVRFDVAQSLTNEQRAQARFNTGSASQEDMAALSSKVSTSVARLIPVLPPAGFGGTDPGFNIWFNTAGHHFEHDFEPDDYSFTPDNTYHVSTAGSDTTGDGSSGNPYRTLQKAADVSRTAGDAAATISISSGVYYNGEVLTSVLDDSYPKLNVTSDDPATMLSTARRGSFAVHSGNCYVMTVSGMVCHGVIDLDQTDDHGHFVRMAKAADTADCVATPGTYYRSGISVYVHKLDGSAVTDANVLALDITNNFRFSGLGLYMKNIQCCGGPSAMDVNMANATSPVALDRCVAHSSWNGAGGLTASNVTLGKKITSYRSAAVYCAYDGFNYHSSGGGGDVVEVECLTANNGNVGAGNSDNGTSVHDGVSIIRVNPVLLNEKNRAIHDVGAGHSWVIAGVVDGLRETTPALDSVAYYCGHPGGDTTKMWLDTCISRGGCATDFAVAPGSTMYVRNCGIGPYSRVDTGVGGVIQGY